MSIACRRESSSAPTLAAIALDVRAASSIFLLRLSTMSEWFSVLAISAPVAGSTSPSLSCSCTPMNLMGFTPSLLRHGSL